MKTLYVVTSNGGDGSSYPCYTFSKAWVDMMEKAEQDGDIDYERWCDGDGFHYDTLTVPDECTPESMGFADLADDNDD